jgi:histidinol-phosphate aminotransferase
MSFADLSYKAIPDDIKLTIIARPNSPCGKVIDRDIVANWKGPLLIDEAYIDFSGDSVSDLIAHKPDLIILRTLSKAYGLAGMRIGFVLSQPAVIHQLKKVRGVYTVDRLAMAAGIAALDDQDYLDATVNTITEERRKLLSDLRSLGFILEDSAANFLWIPSFDLFTVEQLAKQGIYIRAFSTSCGVGARITVGTPEQNSSLITTLRMILGQSLR